MQEMKTLTIGNETFKIKDGDAAPAGYGLGSTAKQIADCDLNNVIENGWYCYNKNAGVTNVPSESPSLLFVESFYNTNFCKQTVTLLDGKGTTCMRVRHSGVWTQWEWLNPPMVLGSEYRTTERWQGKAVYTKMLNVGAFPGAGAVSYYGFGDDITKIIKINGAAANAGFAIPFTSQDESVAISSTVYQGLASIVLYVEKGDFTDTQCIAQVWYTKD